MKQTELLLEKIERAKNDVTSAESDLERLLTELAANERAEKTTISQVIEEAFTKLRSAKSDLAELEQFIVASAKSD